MVNQYFCRCPVGKSGENCLLGKHIASTQMIDQSNKSGAKKSLYMHFHSITSFVTGIQYVQEKSFLEEEGELQ